MDSPQTYTDQGNEQDEPSNPATTTATVAEPIESTMEPTAEPAIEPTNVPADEPDSEPVNPPSSDPQNGNKTETEASEDLSESLKSQDNDNDNDNDIDIDIDIDDEGPAPKKRKHLSSLTSDPDRTPMPEPEREPVSNGTALLPAPAAPNSKKSKKKNNNVWVTKSTRKGKKKTKANNNGGSNNHHNAPGDDTVLITPVTRFPDKTDDTPEMNICLSKVYKAEKVEVSEDRMSAGSTKGYRMVRATRGVVAGAWYFEIGVVKLGETGHTRLGWSTEKGDLQAPVGYDANSFGYRDIDGSKVHKALREKYGEEGYKEGDVIGFYINLPDGASYAPKPPHLVWYKGQRYACAPDAKEDPPKVVPGSEILFFKNGVCQGVAFKDLYGGRYYPAASMYTLPHQPNCVVKFNFGPDFEFFPKDFDGRPLPQPMVDVPYHGFDNRVENGVSDEKKQ